MDSFVYALVLVPSLRELLPRSGIPATKANVGLYGGLLFALFLVGWGLAFLWGPIGDKFGRVRTLMLTIRVVFGVHFFERVRDWHLATGYSSPAGGHWHWRRMGDGRDVCGRGVAGGSTPHGRGFDAHRDITSGYFWRHWRITASAAASAGGRCLSSVDCRRCLLAWIRHGVKEPATWSKKEKVVRSWAIWRPFVTLFSPELRRRTIVNALLMLASICGLWAGTVYVPAAITAVAEAGGRGGAQVAQLASWGIMLVSLATILGCLAMPWLAETLGRRGALAVFFTLMMVFIALTFGKVFYLGAVALPWFFVCLFFLGIGWCQLLRVYALAA